MFGGLSSTSTFGRETSRTTRRAGLCVLSVLALVALSRAVPAVAAEPPAPVVDVMPNQVELRNNAPTTVVVVLRNTSNDALNGARLAWFSDVALRISSDPELNGPRDVPGNGAIAWRLTLAREGIGRRSGAVALQVDYSWVSADASGQRTLVPRVSLGTLQIVPPTAPNIAVEIKTTSASVSANVPRELYVLVKNNSSGEVTLRSVVARAPNFVGVVPIDARRASGARPLPSSVTSSASNANASRPESLPVFDVPIAPGGATEVGFAVTPGDQIPPGKQNIQFEVNVSVDGTDWSFVQSQELDLVVFGETEFSGLLGVPAFLILPGVIIVGTWRLIEGWAAPLRRRTQGGTTAPSAAPLIDLASWKSAPPIAIVIVGLSVLMAFVIYPLLTSAAALLGRGMGRNYLQGYGTSDLALVWAISVATGALAYGMRAALDSSWSAYFDFSDDDDALTMLRKIVRQRRSSGVRLPVATFSTSGGPATAMLVDPRPFSGAGDYWVAPKVLFKPELTNPAGELSQQIEKLIDGFARLRTVVSKLEDGAKAKPRTRHLDVEYQGGGLAGPRLVRLADAGAIGKDEGVVARG